MKKKLLFVLLVMVCCLAACGKKEEPKNETLGSIDESAVDIESTESVEKPVEDNVVAAVKEEDAYVDFDGVKLPIVITWEDFEKFMEEHDWEFIDDRDDFPSEDQFSGAGEILTNCGTVDFKFMENADGTGSELRDVMFYASYTNGKISCCGITNKTKRETLDKILELESENEFSVNYYLDEYLYVALVDTYHGIDEHQGDYDISIERKLYPSRK